MSYLKSLKEKNFHKLIVGAALKDFKSIEDYAYLFTHAEADVIDISAFPHSVISAKAGIEKAKNENPDLDEALIMVSINIGKDPHFRRIELDKESCTECLDCIESCPSQAFSLNENKEFNYNIDLCFGCSNCLPYCKDDALSFSNWNAFETKSLKELNQLGAKAIEIHLNSDLESFEKLYSEMTSDFDLESFCIGSQSSSEEELYRSVDSIVNVVRKKHGASGSFIIQVDGIPLSGARELHDENNKDQHCINKAKLVLDYIKAKYADMNIFVQLAGGTNENSLQKALQQGVPVNGVAIGSYARKKLLLSKNDDEAKYLAQNLIQKN